MSTDISVLSDIDMEIFQTEEFTGYQLVATEYSLN